MAHGDTTPGAVFDGEMEVMIGNYWVMRLHARNGVWEPLRRSKPKFTFVDYGYVVESEGDTNRMKLAIQMRKDGGIRRHIFSMTWT
jgi:hypothetical protein